MSAEGFRIVHDPAATLGGSRCMSPCDRGLPCWLPVGHTGTHLPLRRARYLREKDGEQS